MTHARGTGVRGPHLSNTAKGGAAPVGHGTKLGQPPNGGVWNYTYDSNNQMLTIQDPRGIYYLSNQYDANGRVIQQTQADNTNFTFNYTTDQNGNITQTDTTDPRGITTRSTYDSNNYETSIISAFGKPEQQTITYNRDPNTELVNSTVDALNRETDYGYDANGNVTSITRLAHTSNAVTTSLTYDTTFNQVTSITDPLSHVTKFSYDLKGGLSSITDPLGHQSSFTVNSAGQVATVTDGMGNTSQFSYDGGDLSGTTDPLPNTTTRFSDGAGRLISATNALGRTTRYVYNPLNEITQITDPLQGVTSFGYDLNGNLVTVQDANQNTTTYTYNDHDLVASRTDGLQRTESYNYDTDENLTTFTDRKGQVTTYQYDNLNRMNFVGFGTQGNTYASTISYQYDAGNRMTQATDSISGVITRGYDGLDRLTSETTPQGSIGYTYDNASRRATMQVAGQTQVNYTFDNANRLTQIAQGTSTVGFTYDNGNRRSTLVLPNGIVATYSYDNDSHLTGISYALNSTSVGVLTYGYDALGMRTSVSGSMARTGLPQPIPSASYDSGNELLAWNESALSYDANGNMLSDGLHNYAWDARNHLSTIDAGSTASFVYDLAGRRATKVISGTQTNFLYDLANPVQELSGTTPTANLLTGGLDEYFTRTDANGTANFLTDALGSTGALTDSTGTVQDQYTFDPFGITAQSGTSSTNSFAYTGRESDGTGLYYYRARYYATSFGRFVSEDPLEFGGGDSNLYGYASNSPTNSSDPFGLMDKYHCTLFGGCSKVPFGPPSANPSAVAGRNSHKRMPNKITCGTVLPNGRTVGSYVSELSNNLNQQGNAPPVPTPYGPAPNPDLPSPVSIAQQVYSGTNFRAMFGGPGADYGFLGDAGNFAYGAVSANIGVPLSATELAAGAYSIWEHPSSDWVGPFGMDPSATEQVPAGYGAACEGY